MPKNQQENFIKLWKEFEEKKTPDAIFASSLDGLQPLINHLVTGGYGLKGKKLKTSQVLEKKRYINNASPILWDYAKKIIKESAENRLYIQ